MRIFVTGGTGLIGSQLIPQLSEHNKITVYTRNVSMAERQLTAKITLTSNLDEFANFDAFDAVINLAGEPIVAKRWSDEQKRKIEHSRWDLTDKLVAKIQAGENPPSVFISGSAIGYYGRQGDTEIDETFDQPNDEFSHHLCKIWEQKALAASSDQTRVCLLRTGIVLSKRGGALSKMLPIFKLGLGGRIGTGEQYMSWIHIRDMANGIIFLLENASASGIYNFTAPHPVTNREFSATLAEDIGRPCLLPTPAFALKLAMGEMSDLLLTGQRVIPARLLAEGYNFSFENLDEALASLKL